ncbi:MAG: sensor histidine kinase [Methanoculleus sp.]
MGRESQERPALPFILHLTLAILLATAPVVCLISFVDYVSIRQELEATAQEFQDQTETGIILSMDLVDTGLKIFDGTLNHRMQEKFEPFLAEYERAGRDPAAMDLYCVREDLGEGFDLYIINESGIIEYTTHPSELGYDFTAIPYFYDRITEIRLKETFSADRIVPEIATGEIRKYAYMPTPDRRYLLELGFTDPDLRQWRTMLEYRDTAKELVDLNPNIDEIRLYDSLGTLISGEAHPDDAHRLILARQAYQEKTTLEVKSATTGELIRYLFIDLTDSDYASDVSMVAELTYSTKVAEAKFADMLSRHMSILFIGLVIIGCLSTFAAHLLTRPIRMLVADVNTVADGDLDRPIRTDGAEEFVHLGEGISAMVTALKGTIQRLRESGEELTRYSHTLEGEVRDRTAALEESARMANLYLDIMGHDINNANNVAGLYSDLLLTGLEEGPEEEYLRKAKAELTRSIEIIRNINTNRNIHERAPTLRPTELDPIIRREIEHFPEFDISYTGTGTTVLADDLLPEVFANLIGNAGRFGGSDVGITIRIEDRGEVVEVSVEDTGPGIPDTAKRDLFRRPRKRVGARAGAGLGLHVCRMLIERYGGRIWADDRVQGKPECGVAIRFTLLMVGEEGDP